MLKSEHSSPASGASQSRGSISFRPAASFPKHHGCPRAIGRPPEQRRIDGFVTTTVSSTPAITAGETCHGVVCGGLAPPRLKHSKLDMSSGLIRVPDFGQTMDSRSPEESPSHVMVGVSRLEQVPHHGVHILQAIAHVAQKVFKPRRQRG